MKQKDCSWILAFRTKPKQTHFQRSCGSPRSLRIPQVPANPPGPCESPRSLQIQGTAWAACTAFPSRLHSGWAQLPTEPPYPSAGSLDTGAGANQGLWASRLLALRKGSGTSCRWKDAYASGKYTLGCHKHWLYPWFLPDDTCRINLEKSLHTASGRKCTFLDPRMEGAYSAREPRSPRFFLEITEEAQQETGNNFSGEKGKSLTLPYFPAWL